VSKRKFRDSRVADLQERVTRITKTKRLAKALDAVLVQMDRDLEYPSSPDGNAAQRYMRAIDLNLED
jgi:hypothetical protein